MSLILNQNGICSDASSHSVRAAVAFYFNGGISLAETDWDFINAGTHQPVLKSHDVLLCVVFRLVGGAQTSLRRHGELGAERLRGAEDPVGR